MGGPLPIYSIETVNPVTSSVVGYVAGLTDRLISNYTRYHEAVGYSS